MYLAIQGDPYSIRRVRIYYNISFVVYIIYLNKKSRGIRM